MTDNGFASAIKLRTGEEASRPVFAEPSVLEVGKYGFMAFPLAFAGLPIYLHAPDFYATTLGQPLTGLGIVLLMLRLFDAFQDPVIGSLSDRFDRFRSWIVMIGTGMLAVGFWMIFHPLVAHPLLWFALSVLICTTGFSIVSINLQTLGGLWETSTRARTKITGGREAIGLLGLLTAAILPPLLAEGAGKETAFHMLTLMYVPLLALSCWLLLSWRRSARLLTAPAGEKGIGWLAVLKDRWRASFFGLVFLNTFASAIPAVLVIFFIRDRLDAESYTGLFLLIYFLAGAISMPLWIKLAGQFGKIRAWQISLAVAVLTFCWAAILGSGDIAAYTAVCAFSGIALGADLALPPAILADHIEADARENEASKLFSMMALLSKASLAVATGAALPLLGSFGYVPGEPLSPHLSLVMSVTYAAIPCLLKLICLFALLALEKTLAPSKSAVVF